MAFLDDTRYFGVLSVIIGVFEIAGGVFNGFEDLLISCAGHVVVGLLEVSVGCAIYFGRAGGFLDRLFPEGVDTKFGVVVGYTMTIGLATLVEGAFSLFERTGMGVAGILIGIAIMLIAWTVANDRKTIVDRIIWLILAVMYFLAIALSLIEACAGGVHLITGVCCLLMYLLAFTYLLDDDVKRRF